MNKWMKVATEKYNLAILFTIIFAFVLRIFLYLFMKVDINCDEAMIALDAKSIADSGRDIYGTSLPVYFEAWSWTGQSALPTYLCALFIKMFGSGIRVVRLPFLLLSLVSIVYFFKLNKLLFNKREAMIALMLLAICPWHIIQQLIALDCNMFPHFFIIGLYYFVKGIKEKKNWVVYVSMLFLALTLYCYGVSIFFVPVFLLIAGILGVKKRIINTKTLILSVIIFSLVAIPIVLFYAVNFLKLNSIYIGPVSIQRFYYQARSTDILFFSKNILQQLSDNLLFLFGVMILQSDYCIWNYTPWFGTIYYISMIFIVFGIINRKKNTEEKNSMLVIKLWITLSLILGVIIERISIYRLNIIWYAMIVLCAIGIEQFIDRFGNKVKVGIQVLYALIFVAFVIALTSTYNENLKDSVVFSGGYSEAFRDVKDKSEVYVSEDTYSSSERMLVFAYYEIGNDKEYYFDRELMACYESVYQSKDVFSFNDRFTGIEINEGMILDKDTYIIGESELEKIDNLSDFEIKEHGAFRVLNRIH